MATPQSLNTQKPAARSRAAWCSPAMGTKPRRHSPCMIASMALRVAPTTLAAASYTPRKAGVSPASRNPPRTRNCLRSTAPPTSGSCGNALRAFPHEPEVGGAVERKQFLVRGGARLEHAHAPVEAARLELAHESGVTVRPEWMAIAESVASQALAENHSHAAHVGREAPLRGVSQALQA